KKLLHTPQMALRQDDGEDAISLVTAVQRLFALEVAAPAPLDAEPESASAPKPDIVGDKKAAGQ
ncbi:MAG TPA: hypothetical protein VLT58_03625, partial [Polyangia bacterium]|nr:hypothetical protein [Polyangia bacterium]